MRKILLLTLLIGLFTTLSFAKTSENDEWYATVDWSEVDDVFEWGLHMSMIYNGDVVFFGDSLFMCDASPEPGTYAYSYKWNPLEWEAPRYQTVGHVVHWVAGLEIAGDYEYVIYADKLFKVLNNLTTAEGEEPTAAGNTDYEEMAGVVWGPEIDFPENYVVVWNDYESWQPGFIVFNLDNEKVYKCLKATPVFGNMKPGADEAADYWEELGDADKILSLPGVTVPEWDDERVWLIGSIVKYGDKYYKAKNQTHIGGEEFPDVTGEAAYWEEIIFSLLGNQLPINFVGYWNDNMVWKPGYHSIYEGSVFKCMFETHINGTENPGQVEWGYWSPEPLGTEEDILNIEGVTIPDWTDDCWWPVDAVVSYNGKHYRCIHQTHKNGYELPENTGQGYWVEITNFAAGIEDVVVKEFNCYVDNGGVLRVTSYSGKVTIELYNQLGQAVAKSYNDYVKLPGNGVYIARITVNGKATAVKIVW